MSEVIVHISIPKPTALTQFSEMVCNSCSCKEQEWDMSTWSHILVPMHGFEI